MAPTTISLTDLTSKSRTKTQLIWVLLVEGTCLLAPVMLAYFFIMHVLNFHNYYLHDMSVASVLFLLF